MEEEIKDKLGLSHLKAVGISGGGCISSGKVYESDIGKLYVKINNKHGADIMFRGEYNGLQALKSAGICVPKPYLFGNNYLVLEYVDLKGLSKYETHLAENLAHLHANVNHDSSVRGFGFATTTCCGFLPLNNSWNSNWVDFYVCQRLLPQIQSITRKYGDREVTKLWSALQLKIPLFFKDIEIKPSLLHGDLWSGNAAETSDGPIIFDPATFYGHDEFDLAIMKMFGGFSKQFFTTYHQYIPKRPGFQQRSDLYLLFHNLNHWNHFGDGYRSGSLQIMKSLIKS